MAGLPSEIPAPSFDDASSNAAATRTVSRFWLLYWLIALAAGLIGITLAIANVKHDAVGLLILLGLALLALGLIPWMVASVERQVNQAMSLRLTHYLPRWSFGARAWVIVHGVMLFTIVTLAIVATQLPPQNGKEAFIAMATLFGFGYLVMIVLVIYWRERRKRLAEFAALKELQSFDLQLENDDRFQGMENLLPLFGGKQRRRCPALLQGTLGDWPVVLFDWLDINKQPPRREWITVALVELQQPVSMFHLQPKERVQSTQLHWWHILLEFPFGLIIFLVSAVAHFAGKLRSKPAQTIAHTPALTRNYQLDTVALPQLQTFLSPVMCLEIIKLVHQKKRFMMVNQQWLALASHKKVAPAKNLGELVADALRLADLLEVGPLPVPEAPKEFDARTY